LFALPSFATHIVGGEVFYTWLGNGTAPNTGKYKVTLRLFRACNQECGGLTGVACLPDSALVNVFAATAPFNQVVTLKVKMTGNVPLTLITYPACIANKPVICYEMRTYTTETELAYTTDGYILAYQNCCRAQSVNVNTMAGTSNGYPGSTFDCRLPGTDTLPLPQHNSSAVFRVKDTVLICSSAPFSLDFGAMDADGDSLSYNFTGAYDGGTFSASYDDRAAGPPEYNSVSYKTEAGFSGSSPMGPKVVIDAHTGLISGESPVPGRYVLSVMVTEWRNGGEVGSHRKDFMVRVEDCNPPQAILDPVYLNCADSTIAFTNQSTSPLIHSYYWSFGTESGATSVAPQPVYTFPDTGVFTVKLIINRNQQCTDTTTTQVKIYPGFKPVLGIAGSCVLHPYQFTDLSQIAFGKAIAWTWYLGDDKATDDSSLIQNPSYTYPEPGAKSISFTVTSSVGCTGAASRVLDVRDKPVVELPFKDTTICSTDTIQLRVNNRNVLYQWEPQYNISNATIAAPNIWPRTAQQWYKIHIDEDHCENTDSVLVNVITRYTVSLPNDTVVCVGDNFQLYAVSDAQRFTWVPAAAVNNAAIQAPVGRVQQSLVLTVTANPGRCPSQASIAVKAVPYPVVSLLADTVLCYGHSGWLQAGTNGAYFHWWPVNTLMYSNTLRPLAGPAASTWYTFTATDTIGCPNPAIDSILVRVVPRIYAFAGNDTSVVAEQPLQLTATGATYYAWSPATGLSNSHIYNPIVKLPAGTDSVVYTLTASTPEGCAATDVLVVRVFNTPPDMLVPSAFTPDGNGLNDYFHPIAAGIRELDFFRIYSRWGQLLYQTTDIKAKGWDGMHKGQPQAPGTYVYVVQATDYNGRKIQRKGTVVLIR
jgi:gliding motility-associated-like protein